MKRTEQQITMFQEGEDLPLFSQTAIPVDDSPFAPVAATHKQEMLFDMPVDWEAQRQNLAQQRRGGKRAK